MIHIFRRAALASVCSLAACAPMMERLEQVGQQPPMSKIDNPTERRDYKPVSWPMPDAQPLPEHRSPNSLWQPGSRAFFKDQRAARVGDILKVKVKIKEKAKLENQTDRQRSNSDSLGAPQVFGTQKRLFGWLPGDADSSKLLSIDGSSTGNGKGSIDRQEEIETEVAAMITQVLPNGNYVISGKQEIRVNFEIREVSVSGVIRPEDISTNNTIDSTQIAEARIIYGGRGQITDIQQPRYGTQILDAISPF